MNQQKKHTEMRSYCRERLVVVQSCGDRSICQTTTFPGLLQELHVFIVTEAFPDAQDQELTICQ